MKTVRCFRQLFVDGFVYKFPLYAEVNIIKRRGELMQEALIVNGHFWVVKDDVGIIDPDFPEFESYVRQKFMFENPEKIRTTEKVFVEADEQTQLDAIRMTENITFNPKIPCRFDECPRNARKDQANYGGRIVFGSMGLKQDDGTIKWVYGGEKWKTEKFFNCENGYFPETRFVVMEPMARLDQPEPIPEPKRKKRKCCL